MFERLERPRSRLWLPAALVAFIVACEYEAPPPAYAAPQTQDGTAGASGAGAIDPSQTQDVAVGVDEDDYADTDPSALTDFRATLDPHGTWVDDPSYGMVWVPNADEVGSDFAPYVSNGSWAYDDDYVWVSYYDWGWAPFHYGRWVWGDYGRWAWIPGRKYAGAWVTWRVGPEGYGYVGWGPQAPRHVWRGGVAVAFTSTRPGPVVFCGRDDLFARGVAARVIVGPRATTIAAETHAYVRAEVAGHPLGQSVARGPVPASIGLRADAITHVSVADRATAQARAFARPSTARTLGARPPSPHVVRYSRPNVGGSTFAPPMNTPRPAPRPAAPPPPSPRGGGHHR